MQQRRSDFFTFGVALNKFGNFLMCWQLWKFICVRLLLFILCRKKNQNLTSINVKIRINEVIIVYKYITNYYTLKSLSNIIWLCGMLGATSFWGWKLDGKEDKENPSQSSTLNPLGRYSRPLQISTLPTIRNFIFFIFLKQLASSCNFVGSSETIIMPRMLSDHWLDKTFSELHHTKGFIKNIMPIKF